MATQVGRFETPCFCMGHPGIGGPENTYWWAAPGWGFACSRFRNCCLAARKSDLLPVYLSSLQGRGLWLGWGPLGSLAVRGTMERGHCATLPDGLALE